MWRILEPVLNPPKTVGPGLYWKQDFIVSSLAHWCRDTSAKTPNKEIIGHFLQLLNQILKVDSDVLKYLKTILHRDQQSWILLHSDHSGLVCGRKYCVTPSNLSFDTYKRCEYSKKPKFSDINQTKVYLTHFSIRHIVSI